MPCEPRDSSTRSSSATGPWRGVTPRAGGAALWTGIEAPSYAPDVPLSGIAALAPAADLASLAKGLQTSKAGMLFASFMVAGYCNAYPDVSVNDYIRASARTVVRRVVGRCLSEPATPLSLPAVLTGEQIFSRAPDNCSTLARASWTGPRPARTPKPSALTPRRTNAPRGTQEPRAFRSERADR
jgi:Secretory lipase